MAGLHQNPQFVFIFLYIYVHTKTMCSNLFNINCIKIYIFVWLLNIFLHALQNYINTMIYKMLRISLIDESYTVDW